MPKASSTGTVTGPVVTCLKVDAQGCVWVVGSGAGATMNPDISSPVSPHLVQGLSWGPGLRVGRPGFRVQVSGSSTGTVTGPVVTCLRVEGLGFKV